MMRYLIRFLLAAWDLGALYIAFLLGWLTRFRVLPLLFPNMTHSEQPFALYWEILLPSAIILLFLTAREGMFRFGYDDLRRQVYGGFKCVTVLVIIALAYLVVFRLNFEFSRLGTVFALAWLFILLPAGRVLLLAFIHRRGLLAVPTLIIGEEPRFRAFLEAAGGIHYSNRTHILAQISVNDLLNEAGDDFTPEADALVLRLLEKEGLDKVVVFMEGISRDRLTTILRRFEIRISWRFI